MSKHRPKVIVHNHYSTHDRSARDTWYHDSQVNGYYILKGAVGDEGRWLVRNGKYDIVKTASSKSEAESFAKSQKNGGANRQQIAADRRHPARDATVEGKVVKVGDVVGFKSDYEQYGKITAINGDKLTLYNPNGFGGEYLRYATTTVERASDCWLR